MYGAIIGDLAGSIYEYGQTKKVTPIKVNNLIEERSFYSDDTILTIAILRAILDDKSYEFYLRIGGINFNFYRPNIYPYFKTPFSPSFTKWAHGRYEGTSKGNGAMMKISPVGYLFDSEEEVIENARAATVPSHNDEESIRCATTIALIIYYFRKGLTKEEVIRKLNLKFEYKPFTKVNYQSAKANWLPASSTS